MRCFVVSAHSASIVISGQDVLIGHCVIHYAAICDNMMSMCYTYSVSGSDY